MSSISTIRRQVKNVAYNFSDAQVKVREATSNDPWGPSSSLMSEIADLTHNPMAFTETMSLLWKRLNDHGKNWRHVYKSLVLLDYLIKCGSDKVAQQCRENIYSIETLKDFQHIEENKDQGLNVREKAKQMVALLYDEERLKNERARAIMTRKKFAQNSVGISSDGQTRHMRKSDTYVETEKRSSSVGKSSKRRRAARRKSAASDPEMDDVRPSSAGEEELQLQIALALSREENQREEELRKGDDVRLQMALNESRKDADSTHSAGSSQPLAKTSVSVIDDLLSLGPPMPSNPTGPTNNAPWGGPVADPWSPAPVLVADPWEAAPSTTANDIFATPVLPQNGSTEPSSVFSPSAHDPWTPFDSNEKKNGVMDANQLHSKNSFDLNGISDSLSIDENATKQRSTVKTPENFLGENSALVNLDNLLGASKPLGSTVAKEVNPFASTNQPTNPFAAQQRPSPTINEMRAQNSTSARVDWGPQPLQPNPTTSQPSTNPFL